MGKVMRKAGCEKDRVKERKLADEKKGK